jgi:DNA polymerase III subunit beta
MKVSARASSLDAALTLAMMATRRGKVAPVIHVIAAGDAVSFTCSAPGISVRVSADAKVDIPGSVTVSDRLAALVSGFDQKADINISAEDGVATISCGRGRYRLPVLPGPLSIVRGLSGETASVEVSGQDLLALLEVLPAAGSEATRFYLTGVYLHNVDDRLISVCTDGIKLLRASVVAGMLSTDEHLIVPAKVAHALARLVEQTRAHVVTLRRSNSMFCVTASGFELVTSLIDATYPAYQRVIPPASSNNAHCVRSELHEALLRLEAVAAGTEAPLVALSWADGGPLQLFLPRQPLDAVDVINAEAHGSAQVALSLSQLRTMVANFDDDRLHIESADADTPITIRGEHDRLGVLFSCRWNFETEKRPASARSSAKPTATADQRTENRG